MLHLDRIFLRPWLGLVALLAVLGPRGVQAAPPPAPDAAGVEFFERKVRPVLVKHCYACHSAQAKTVRGELRLDTREGVQKGGVSGPAIVPGQPARSRLIELLRHPDESQRMPPKGPLTAEEIADLEAWVKMGAPDPRVDPASTPALDPAQPARFWAFQPVRDPPVPAVKNTAWSASPIDRFILARQEAKGIRPLPSAEKRVLIRRATYDLTGLPPTPEEIEAFLQDSSPDAFARVVERLLASPAYGERWGRHWLDVIRYADTAGDNSDYPIPQMYLYRNWVIDVFNRDMPYDEFVRRQLAGDLLPASSEPERIDKLIATGYLANARRFGSYEDERYPWHLTIEDTIDNLGKAFLGLTISCARCHDHKFDPLTQQDYYALYGFFQSTRYPRPGIELDKVQRDFIPLVPPDRVMAFEQMKRDRIGRLETQIKHWQAEKGRWDQAVRDAARAPTDLARQWRTFVAQRRAAAAAEQLRSVRTEKDQVEKAPPPYETAYAVTDRPTQGKRKVGNACVQIKGDPERLGPEVPRRFPTVLGGQTLPPDAHGSGRQELARWITDPKNPLTARVMVNRIWQYHFGRGIVRTPNDFGRQGRSPTHPELLDYLTTRFVESGWSIKAMHRLIMLSRTYQLSSHDDAANARLDPDNELFWHYPRRRLDAESIRDAMLAVSGTLDRSPGGAHPFPAPTTWDFTQHKPFKAIYDSNRRSVYLMTQRIQRHPFLALFDGADPNASTANRITSTTPLQALFLMNDPFVHTQAQKLARRLLAEQATEPERVTYAYQLVFGRLPTATEQATAADYLVKVTEKLRAAGTPAAEMASRAWTSFTRVLFLSNEFVYLD